MGIGNSNEIKEVSQDLKLVFNVSKHCFKYAIFNSIKNCFEKIKSHKIDANTDVLSAEIEKIINIDPELRKKYAKILGTLNNKFSTFIPAVLFDNKNINQYIDFTYGTTDEECQFVKQKFTNCYEVFTIDSNLVSLLKTHFKNLELKSSSSVFVDYAINLNLKNTQNILIQVNKNHFHIILISNGKFQFHNLFYFKNSNDFIYYLMNCLQILGLKGNDIKLHVTSELEKTNTLFEILKKYVKIHFMDRPSTFLYQDNIMLTSPHKHHNLFSQLICE